MNNIVLIKLDISVSKIIFVKILVIFESLTLPRKLNIDCGFGILIIS